VTLIGQFIPAPWARYKGVEQKLHLESQDIICIYQFVQRQESTMAGILWMILVVVLVLWLIGFLVDVGGSLVHLLLVVALLILIYNLITGRRAV
jgi:hypothetical protein